MQRIAPGKIVVTLSDTEYRALDQLQQALTGRGLADGSLASQALLALANSIEAQRDLERAMTCARNAMGAYSHATRRTS